MNRVAVRSSLLCFAFLGVIASGIPSAYADDAIKLDPALKSYVKVSGVSVLSSAKRVSKGVNGPGPYPLRPLRHAQEPAQGTASIRPNPEGAKGAGRGALWAQGANSDFDVSLRMLAI